MEIPLLYDPAIILFQFWPGNGIIHHFLTPRALRTAAFHVKYLDYCVSHEKKDSSRLV